MIMSKTSVSKVTEVLWEVEIEAFQKRDLSDFDVEYLFLAPIYKTLRKRYGMKQDDLDELLNHLKIPMHHRRKVRTTNLIQRSFEEKIRRTKVILGFFD